MASLHPRSMTISTGTMIRFIALLATVAVAWLIRDILLTLFTAMLLAGVMYPFAHWAESKRIPKGIAVFALYIILFGVIVAAIWLLVPAIVDEIGQIVSSYGQSGSFTQALDALREFSRGLGLQSFAPAVSDLQGQATEVFSRAISTLTNLFGGVVAFFVVLVLSFYMIMEERAAKEAFRSLVPSAYQEVASRVIWQIIEKLGDWLRGQVILSLIIGLLYFVAFSIIGLPYALLLAVLGGLLEFIPYIGPFLAAIPAVFFGFVTAPITALIVLAAMVLIQQIENNVIVPKVMQKTVGLNPIVSLVAFMIGAQMFGVIGGIFAIPVATALSVATVEIMRFRRND